MTTQSLNGAWQLRHEPLRWDASRAPDVPERADGWLAANVPTDVRVPLIEAGVINDPVEGLECFESEWVEKRSWWFMKRFVVGPEVGMRGRIELAFESLDVGADVFLNGRHLGRQESSYYPFVFDVTELLGEGENLLLVRLTTGLERVSEEEIAATGGSVSMTDRRGDPRRVAVRKPAYCFGWDWGPRIATCGIVGDVTLRAFDDVVVRGCSVETREASPERALLRVTVETELPHPYRTAEGTVSCALSRDGREAGAARTRTLLRSGITYVELEVEVQRPALWWPNGMGEQPLYDVAVAVDLSTGDRDEYPRFRVGIRTLRLNLEPVAESTAGEAGAADRTNGTVDRLFALEINGRRLFSRGGNWIPADSIYARVSDEKYRTLIEEAREANFTMLRIWGGGLYEREVFYESCDELGVLVWQDFMFACALYPDDREPFVREAEREIDYQTRRLRNHASLALFCGNNENHWGFHSWWVGEAQAEFPGGAHVYNVVAPRVIRANCPHIPYWNSSPYGGPDPNGNEVGDRHHWHDCTMNPDMEKRITPEEYDTVRSKFVSEYGYIGPCVKSSIERYHAGAPVERHSELWNWHNNTFEKDTVVAGITKHYREADDLALDDYLLYASLCQALMYGYSLESIRFTEHCWGGLFWMYNDCWGEVGWTIIDYYLKRKPSYYAVKRAFAPRKLALRRRGDEVALLGANDGADAVSLEIEHGYLSFDGSVRTSKTRSVTMAPGAKGELFRFALPDGDLTAGACFAAPAGSPESHDVLPVTLRTGVFRSLHMPAPRVRVCDVAPRPDGARFTVSSESFAHAVHFNLGDEARYSDAWFDLLPGEERTVVAGNLGRPVEEPEIAAVAIAPQPQS